MKGFFEGLPRELEEAARLDGAGEFAIFRRVMLPLTRPALATIAIFLFLQNWNEFLFALTFITEGGMRTLPTGIYALLSSEFYGNYPILAAVPGAVLHSRPRALLRVPAAVHRGAHRRRAQALTAPEDDQTGLVAFSENISGSRGNRGPGRKPPPSTGSVKAMTFHRQ